MLLINFPAFHSNPAVHQLSSMFSVKYPAAERTLLSEATYGSPKEQCGVKGLAQWLNCVDLIMAIPGLNHQPSVPVMYVTHLATGCPLDNSRLNDDDDGDDDDGDGMTHQQRERGFLRPYRGDDWRRGQRR